MKTIFRMMLIAAIAGFLSTQLLGVYSVVRNEAFASAMPASALDNDAPGSGLVASFLQPALDDLRDNIGVIREAYDPDRLDAITAGTDGAIALPSQGASNGNTTGDAAGEAAGLANLDRFDIDHQQTVRSAARRAESNNIKPVTAQMVRDGELSYRSYQHQRHQYKLHRANKARDARRAMYRSRGGA